MNFVHANYFQNALTFSFCVLHLAIFFPVPRFQVAPTPWTVPTAKSIAAFFGQTYVDWRGDLYPVPVRNEFELRLRDGTKSMYKDDQPFAGLVMISLGFLTLTLLRNVNMNSL
jgi:hypothetical protein